MEIFSSHAVKVTAPGARGRWVRISGTRAAGHHILRILAVGDSPEALSMLRLSLSAQGFEVVTANTAAEALDRLEALAPDLMVCSYNMPGLSGLDLCQQVQSRGRIPIIVYTGSDLSRTRSPADDLLSGKTANLHPLARLARSLVAASETARLEG